MIGIDGKVFFCDAMQSCPQPSHCEENSRCCGIKKSAKEKELVNHPDHYGGGDNTYEVIKVLRAWATPDEFYGWLKLTILKYQGRLGKKDLTEIEIGKMIWYMNYLKDWVKETRYKPK